MGDLGCVFQAWDFDKLAREQKPEVLRLAGELHLDERNFQAADGDRAYAKMITVTQKLLFTAGCRDFDRGREGITGYLEKGLPKAKRLPPSWLKGFIVIKPYREEIWPGYLHQVR
jgi:hypothetical protein